MVEKAKQKNLRAHFGLNVEFHALLGQASGNNHLATILENLGKQTFRFRYLSLSLPGRIQKTVKNHRRLIVAIRARKEREAEKIAYGNIEEAKEALLQYISDHPEIFHPGNRNSAPRLRK
jgi:DNA-binding GntR family transcriptional regulator